MVKKLFGKDIHPGWNYIKETAEIEHEEKLEGQVHGQLVKFYFNMQPSDLVKNFGAVFSGFSII